MSLHKDAKDAALIKGVANIILTAGNNAAGSVVMNVRWIGDKLGTASLEVDAATGDYEFTTDGTTADTTIGIPTLNGTIDTSNAAGNTYGEVVDNINASTNWEAELVGALRSDVSTNTTLTLAETTSVSDAAGVVTTFDPVVEYDGTDFLGMAIAIHGSKFKTGNTWRKEHDNGGFINELFYVNCDLTYASGVVNIDIFECDDVNNTETRIARFPAAATTVTKEIGDGSFPIISAKRGSRLVVRSTGDAAFTGAAGASWATATGRSYNPDLVLFE